MSTKSKIRYGKKDVLTDDDFKNCKIRVTAFVDEDILRALKEKAADQGTKYQTLMNQILREALFGKKIDPELRDQIREVVREELKKKSA